MRPLVHEVVGVVLKIVSMPQTLRLPPIPTPPDTVNAPLLQLVLGVVLVIATGPAKEPLPQTFKLPPMPTPPATTNAPLVHLVLTPSVRNNFSATDV